MRRLLIAAMLCGCTRPYREFDDAEYQRQRADATQESSTKQVQPQTRKEEKAPKSLVDSVPPQPWDQDGGDRNKQKERAELEERLAVQAEQIRKATEETNRRIQQEQDEGKRKEREALAEKERKEREALVERKRKERETIAKMTPEERDELRIAKFSEYVSKQPEALRARGEELVKSLKAGMEYRAKMKRAYIEAHPELPETIREAFVNDRCCIGMSREAARIVLYLSKVEVKRTVSGSGVQEQWVVYSSFLKNKEWSIPNETIPRYVYFEDGILTSWQEEEEH